ncbi:MAG: DUF2752 domain-containing protein [Acidobacteria bacterium]|nr:DUF2752 domain-containing protein [Acidobacteriota bacterium]
MADSIHRQAETQEMSSQSLATGGISAPYASAERHLAWVTLVGLSAVFIISMLWRPADEPTVIICPFRALTGLLCPGCGMTRAFCALGHGELRRAIHFNALSPFLYLSFIIVWVGAAATVFKLDRVKGAVMRLRPNMTASMLMLGLVLVWWVVRLVYGF